MGITVRGQLHYWRLGDDFCKVSQTLPPLAGGKALPDLPPLVAQDYEAMQQESLVSVRI
jgi:hypothetical protein